MEAMRRVSAGNMSPDTQKAINALKGEGSKLTKANIAIARTYQKIVSKGGQGVAKLVEGFKKSKLKISAAPGLIIELGMLWMLNSEIDAMLELGELTKEEADYLKENAAREAKFRIS